MHTPRTWDPERIREVVGDDREILLELVSLFFEDTQQRLEKLQRSLVGGDLLVTRNEAHAIKGSAGNFGAERLHEVSRRLEDAARAGELASARELGAHLRTCFQELRSVLKRANVGVS
ncbi:MAG: Hpt domain-containing protein [Planctomycetes bacterium]|nr:Hpt domain-containing protein [Planctomycetota bacterium]